MKSMQWDSINRQTREHGCKTSNRASAPEKTQPKSQTSTEERETSAKPGTRRAAIQKSKASENGYRTRKGLSASEKPMPKSRCNRCQLLIFAFLSVGFLFLFSNFLTLSVEAADASAYKTVRGGTEYATFEQMMAAVNLSFDSGTLTDEICVIYGGAEGTEDIIITVSTTIRITGEVAINAVVSSETQKIVFVRGAALEGPMFDIEEGGSLRFIQTTDGMDSADASIGNKNASFVLDGASSPQPLIAVGGMFTFSKALSSQNADILYTCNGGSVNYAKYGTTMILVDETTAYYDLQKAVDAATKSLTFLGYTTNDSGVYTGTAEYTMTSQVTVPTGKKLWLTADVGSGQDLFILHAATEFSGQAAFLIEEGATLAIDSRRCTDDGGFTADAGQSCQFKLDTDFLNGSSDILPDEHTPLLFDIKGDLLLGRIAFYGSDNAILVRSGSNVQISQGELGNEYTQENNGAVIFYYETLFVPGFSDMNPVSVATRAEFSFVPEEFSREYYQFRGWSETIYSAVGTGYSDSEPFVVSGAKTLYAAWTLVDITAVLTPQQVTQTYTGESVTLTVETSPSFAVIEQYYLSGGLVSSVLKEVKWFYNGEELPSSAAEGDSLALTDVSQSGVYTCQVYISAGDYAAPLATANSVTVTITKAKIEKPSPATTEFIYTGSEISLGIAQNETYSLIGHANTNVGTYTATVTLQDTENYEWSDGSTQALSFAWVIQKKNAEIILQDKNSVYGEALLPLSYTTLGFLNGFEPVVSMQKAPGTEAGVYAITATVALEGCDNYNITVTNATYTIEKAVYSLSGITFADASFYYDGAEKSIFITGTLPYGVTVSYEGNAVAAIGVYTVRAIFSGDSYNYEPPGVMQATLTILSDISDPALIANAVKEMQGVDASWLSAAAKDLYDALLQTYTERAIRAATRAELTRTLSDFYTALDDFAVQIDAGNIAGQATVYYHGDTVDDGFYVRLHFFNGSTALLLGSYTVTYENGDCFQTGDTAFTVTARGLSVQVRIPAVLSYRPENIRFVIANETERYTYGDDLPPIQAQGFSGNEPVLGVFAWTEETLSRGLQPGDAYYTFTFTPDGESAFYEGRCLLHVEKALPLILDVFVLAEQLTYGDDLPKIDGSASVAGRFQLEQGQVLHAGEASYTYTFIPDDEGYQMVTGDLTLSVRKAALVIKAENVVIYEGNTPVFPISYTGLKNGDTAVDLLSMASVVDPPVAVGVYTVLPSGAISNDYDIQYLPSQFTIIDNAYKAVVTDNEDEGLTELAIGEGNILRVFNRSNRIDDAMQAQFSLYAETVYALLPDERLIRLYELTIVDENGEEVSGTRILQLAIPEEYTSGYAIHIVDCTNGFSFISAYGIEDGILAFTAPGNGKFAIAAIPESDVCRAINETLEDTAFIPDDESVNRLRARYDLLSREAVATYLSTENQARLAAIFQEERGKVHENTGNASENHISASGLSGVRIPEINDPDVTDIQFMVTAVKKQNAALDITPTGKEFITMYELTLHKTCYRYQDGKMVPYVSGVDNSDIRDFITLYLPIEGSMLSFDGYEVWYVDEQGNLSEKMNGYLTEVEGKKYLAFETMHFSSFAVVGQALPIAQNTRAATAWLIIAGVFAAVVIAFAAGRVFGWTKKAMARKKK